MKATLPLRILVLCRIIFSVYARHMAKVPQRFSFVSTVFFLFIFLGMTSGLSHSATTPVFQFLSPLTEKLNSPTSVAFDNQGRIYVTNSRNNRILIFNQQGQEINVIKGLADPISVAVDDAGKVYVGNEKKGNVEVFDANYTFLHKLGFRDDEFVQPNDITIDNGTGNIYVADYQNNVVGIYNAAGAFVRNLGEPGSADGEFSSPLSVAIDVNAGEIIVLDRGLIKIGGGMMGSWVPGARFQFFSMDGTFLRSFNKLGNATGDLVRPQRLEVDQLSRLYVTDSHFNAVLMYDNIGGYLGAIFDNDNLLRSPIGVSLDSHNKLYVASHLKKRVEVYGIDEFINMSASPGNLFYSVKEGEMSKISQAITVLNNGNKSFTWTAVANDNWVNIADQQSVLNKGAEGSLQASVDTTGFKPGDYVGSISIYIGAVEMAVINVNVTVEPAPVLSVTPPTLEFTAEVGSMPLPQVVTIANNGSLPLQWSLSADQSWIVTKSFAGTLPNFQSGVNTVAVYPDTRSLEAGTYTGSIMVIGQGAVASPMLINVVVTLTEPTNTPGKGKGKDKYKDTDDDGIPDYRESCPQDPYKLEPGICGCGIVDEDTNNNDIIDCLEKKKGKLYFPIKLKDGSIILISL